MGLHSYLLSKLLPPLLASHLTIAALWGPCLPLLVMGKSLSLSPQPEGPLSPRGIQPPEGSITTLHFSIVITSVYPSLHYHTQ